MLLHNRYQQGGGEDAVVAAEADLLRRYGHQVLTEIVSNDAIDGFGARVTSAILASFNPIMARNVGTVVDGFRPDVMHVHNFFPRLSPQVHRAVARRGIAVVQTLHNFRLMCAAATFFRDGKPCEACLGRIGVPAIRHACYRGSRVGSAAVVAMQATARVRNIWERDVDRFIALTEFARQKFIEGGLSPSRIVVKPNFTDASGLSPRSRKHRGALFVGRLATEKGVRVLVDAWQRLPGHPLTVIGSGPLERELRGTAPPNVVFAGNQPPAVVADAMQRAALLVVPSLWYEGFPMVVIEAAASGLPVLASRIGSLAEIVEPGVLGELFTAGSADELAAAAVDLLGRPEHIAVLSRRSRLRHAELYSAEVNIKAVERVYEAAILERGRSSSASNA
jgi:glycosyltransferase involved in cell wall biosynthesis